MYMLLYCKTPEFYAPKPNKIVAIAVNELKKAICLFNYMILVVIFSFAYTKL